MCVSYPVLRVSFLALFDIVQKLFQPLYSSAMGGLKTPPKSQCVKPFFEKETKDYRYCCRQSNVDKYDECCTYIFHWRTSFQEARRAAECSFARWGERVYYRPPGSFRGGHTSSSGYIFLSVSRACLRTMSRLLTSWIISVRRSSFSW